MTRLLSPSWLLPVALLVQLIALEPAIADKTEPASEFSLRTGSSVGQTEIFGQELFSVGGQIAVTARSGQFAIEGDHEWSRLFFYTGHTNERRGNWQRTGLSLKVFLPTADFLPRPLSKFEVFVEAVTGVQRGRLDGTPYSRRDIGLGTGWTIAKGSNFGPFSSFGWQLGWRMLRSNNPSSELIPRIVCSKNCTAPKVERSDWSMRFTSSLVFAF